MRNENIGSDTTLYHITFDAADDYADIVVDVGGTTATTLRIYANGTIAPPTYTSTARDALGNEVDGQLIFNSTTGKLNVYVDPGWEAVTST